MKSPDLEQHWRYYYGSNFLSPYKLKSHEDFIVTIKGIEQAEVMPSPNSAKQTVLTLNVGMDKPFVLNKTNANVIESLYGLKPANWIGKSIIVKIDKNIRVGGVKKWGFRVIKMKPQTEKIDTTPFIAKLKECKDLETLKSVFLSFPKNVRPIAEVKNLTNQLKEKLSNNENI